MNLLEQIKQKASQVKGNISLLLNPSKISNIDIKSKPLITSINDIKDKSLNNIPVSNNKNLSNTVAYKLFGDNKDSKIIETKNIDNKNYLQEESKKIQDSSFLNTPVDKVVNTLKCAESFCGNEDAFKNYIAKKAPWRLDLEDVKDKYGNAGKFGWVVGFTVGTRDNIEKKAKEGDIRYQKLLEKLNFDTEENAIKSALEYWKFRNTAHDKSGKPIGNKYEDIEEAYVNIYNASDVASGDRARARENWKTHFNK